jgi:hypothetical protein
MIELPAAVRVFVAGTKYGQTRLLRHESESLCVFITDECNIVVNRYHSIYNCKALYKQVSL